MGTFTKISQTAFDELQVEAGVLLNSFDIENPAAPASADIVTATTGGITASCIPQYEDWGEDIDNCPINVMETKRITGWDCKLSTTALGTSPTLLRLLLGAADISGSRVTPRRQLRQTDFDGSLWWVGDRADGGIVAIELKNALSTGGLSVKTTKNGKGQLGLEITGHFSASAQDEVPMVFYVVEGSGGSRIAVVGSAIVGLSQVA